MMMMMRCASLRSARFLRKVSEMLRMEENKQRVSLGFPVELVVAESQ